MMFELSERLLNRFISESTPAARQARDLGGKSLRVHLSGLPLAIELAAHDGRVSIRAGSASDPSVNISASALDLLQLLQSDPLTRLRRTRAEISGELQVAEDFGKLLAMAAPDLEAELARWIGDIPAHQVGRVIRGTQRWAGKSHQAFEANLAEFLHEESGALPTANDLESFFADVEELRDDVERMWTRFEQIDRKSQWSTQ